VSLMEKIYRVSQDGATFYAVERGGELLGASGDPFSGLTAGAAVRGGLAGVRVLAPVRPSKIVCVGLNYKDHAGEVGKSLPAEPLLFIKPPSALIGPGDPIRRPPGVGRVDHEAELGIVIGRRAHRVAAANAWDYILGVTCVNDVTARDLQKQEPQYTRCKGFDTFAPIGPCIATGLGTGPRLVEGFVNGRRRQSSSTRHLIFPIEHLVEFITFVMTLEPGDIISTGTPEGIGPLVAGDSVTIAIDGVGELTNPVTEDA
jgi:2-keto-4-pentenoate hydratase/2-oxohepta-3-ene-1,7-dioic acid hydratase in catechol pathway